MLHPLYPFKLACRLTLKFFVIAAQNLAGIGRGPLARRFRAARPQRPRAGLDGERDREHSPLYRWQVRDRWRLNE